MGVMMALGTMNGMGERLTGCSYVGTIYDHDRVRSVVFGRTG